MTIRKIAFASVIAAVYAALTIGLSFMSYGHFQFRVAEALCVLPFFFPFSIWGLFVGCILANAFNPLGFVLLDIIFGSLATLLAALCTMFLGKLGRDKLSFKILACFPPVFFNAIIIGLVIAFFSVGQGEAIFPLFIFNGAWVGLGELSVLYLLGLPLLIMLPKTGVFKHLTGILSQDVNSVPLSR